MRSMDRLFVDTNVLLDVLDMSDLAGELDLHPDSGRYRHVHRQRSVMQEAEGPYVERSTRHVNPTGSRHRDPHYRSLPVSVERMILDSR